MSCAAMTPDRRWQADFRVALKHAALEGAAAGGGDGNDSAMPRSGGRGRSALRQLRGAESAYRRGALPKLREGDESVKMSWRSGGM